MSSRSIRMATDGADTEEVKSPAAGPVGGMRPSSSWVISGRCGA
ncbi:hypothetical protein [Streptomyces sp. YIM 121038]|nr:hypothetical protein [Streptomyces sp. YIM 121038]